jgi:hypothetical protein
VNLAGDVSGLHRLLYHFSDLFEHNKAKIALPKK